MCALAHPIFQSETGTETFHNIFLIINLFNHLSKHVSHTFYETNVNVTPSFVDNYSLFNGLLLPGNRHCLLPCVVVIVMDARDCECTIEIER